MEKALRRASLKRVLPRLLVCLLAAIILLALTVPGVVRLLIGPESIGNLSASELEGRYVSVDVSRALGGFATYSSDDTVVEEYFILALDNGQYAAISAKGSDIDLLETAGEQAEDYYVNGTLDTLSELGLVSGTVTELPEELREYMDSALETMSGFIPELAEADLSEVTVYSCLEIGKLGLMTKTPLLILFGIGFVFLALGVIQIVLLLSGFYQKNMREAVARVKSGGVTQAALEEDFSSAKCVEHMRVGRLMTWYQVGAKSYALDNSRIVWTYCQIEPLVVSSYRWPLCFWMRNGQRLEAHLKKQRDAKAVIKALEDSDNHFLSGYDPNWLRRCTEDFEAFATSVEQGETELNGIKRNV